MACALLMAQQEQQRRHNRTKTRSGDSITTRTTGWKRSKPIVLERSCLHSDRPENHKTAPRQRPVPVEPAGHAATSASKTIRLFLSPHLGLRHRSVPLAGEKQEQHPAAITRTQHDRLEGEPRLPLVLSALPNWRVCSLAAGPACCLSAHVSLYDSSSGVPGDHPLVLSARQLARCAHLVRAPPCRLPPGRCLAVRCTVAVAADAARRAAAFTRCGYYQFHFQNLLAGWSSGCQARYQG